MPKKKMIASAPGKIILFGEHSVVYGRPALAVPVTQVKAICQVEPAPIGEGITIIAPDIGQQSRLAQTPPKDPLAAIIRQTLLTLNLQTPPNFTLTISSTIPIARGLGSGAAISTAIVQALGEYFDHSFDPQTVSNIVFEVEKMHHGTPSGLDNTVVAFAQPIFFQKGCPLERLTVHSPLTFVIGDTGIKSPTYKAVGDLRRRWTEDKGHYERYFDQMGTIAIQARRAIERGEVERVGQCMIENQAILKAIGISIPALDDLVETALEAGALGAKLSGGGWGGNMIALTRPERTKTVAQALREGGAVNTIATVVR
jgi:mevalonate kinase